MNAPDVADRIRKCMANEDRKDTEFRTIITTTEFGDFFEYVLADLKKNRRGRSCNVSQDEVLACGQMFVQLGAMVYLRNINLEETIEFGLKNHHAVKQKNVVSLALSATAQFADAVKYISHDSQLNPGARPHGTFEEEITAYRKLMAQLFKLANLRNINVDDAFELGLKNWEDADWRKRQAEGQGNELRGIGVVPGTARGVVYVLSAENPADRIPANSILVAEFARPELVEHFDKVVALVTDHGGATSHAANIAREKLIPCVVGTGKATKILKHGQEIILTVPGEGRDVEIKFEIVKR